jgi:hypothetical protein
MYVTAIEAHMIPTKTLNEGRGPNLEVVPLALAKAAARRLIIRPQEAITTKAKNRKSSLAVETAANA